MFVQELKQELDDFEICRALQLSRKIHNAEVNGYEVTTAEERLWSQLTNSIEGYKFNS